MSAIPWLDMDCLEFPPTQQALEDPNGLLAVGGDLSPERILQAYRLGIFPWFDDSQPILWWSPNPRAVLFPHKHHISKSLQKRMRQLPFCVTSDQCFADVIRACAAPRARATGTWITAEMETAYLNLHQRGYAHSIETWLDGVLVGGLYGIAIGKVFYGESMFSRATDASKVAFYVLVEHLKSQGFRLIDCQVPNDHLLSLGAELIPRDEFEAILKLGDTNCVAPSNWQINWSRERGIEGLSCDPAFKP